MKKNTVPTIVILVVTGLALISIGLIVGVLLLRQPLNQPLISQPTATALSETSPAATLTPESQATPTAGASSQPTTQIPADVAAQMDEIQQQVTNIRGLSLKSSFNRDLLTTDQLKQNVINDFSRTTPLKMQPAIQKSFLPSVCFSQVLTFRSSTLTFTRNRWQVITTTRQSPCM